MSNDNRNSNPWRNYNYNSRKPEYAAVVDGIKELVCAAQTLVPGDNPDEYGSVTIMTGPSGINPEVLTTISTVLERKYGKVRMLPSNEGITLEWGQIPARSVGPTPVTK